MANTNSAAHVRVIAETSASYDLRDIVLEE